MLIGYLTSEAAGAQRVQSAVRLAAGETYLRTRTSEMKAANGRQGAQIITLPPGAEFVGGPCFLSESELL